MKYLGCAYYPEYWGRERFAEDARLMREAGINIARVGEFAWSRMEPEEGRYTLDWLHECIETLGRSGVEVLMCTPTAAPPAWLTSAYPDVLLVRGNGSRAAHGARRHYCSTSDTFRRHSARISDVLSREVARHKNVTAWQIDNELGPEAGWCYCENCQARFQKWLRDRYGTLDELNRRWGTGFWSMDHSDWRQVRLADAGQGAYPSRVLDSKRFWSDMMADYGLAQATIIRRNHPSAIVSTNGMGPVFPPIDYYKLFGQLDVACDDLYFDIATMDCDVEAMNVFRSMKPGKPFWITETGSGALDHGRPPHPDQLRAWAWSGLAHGSDGHVIFRWRTCLSGQEQELQGILEHSGRAGHRYKAVQRCFLEIAGLRSKLADLPLPEAPVAIVQDYDVLWGYESSRVGGDVNYLGAIGRLHKALYDRNIVADFIPPDRDLAGYKLVVLPSLVMIGQQLADRLKDYVRGGGTVYAFGQIGMRDFNDNYLPVPGPQHLGELFGVAIEGGMYLLSHVGPDEALWVPAAKAANTEIPLFGRIAGEPVSGSARAWIGDLTLKGGADVLLAIAGEAYKDQPAAVEKKTGEGSAIYLAAADVNDELLEEMVEHALNVAGVERGPETPEHVEVVRRGKVTFVINHTNSPTNVALDKAGKAIVGTFEKGVAKLGPYGVCVVEKP